MKKYYSITWNLDIVPLGEHEDIDSADQVAMSMSNGSPNDSLYIAERDALIDLMKQIGKVVA